MKPASTEALNILDRQRGGGVFLRDNMVYHLDVHRQVQTDVCIAKVTCKQPVGLGQALIVT